MEGGGGRGEGGGEGGGNRNEGVASINNFQAILEFHYQQSPKCGR